MDLKKQIASIVAKAAQEITDLVAQQALDAVSASLAGATPSRNGRRGRGSTAAPSSRTKGAKRSPEALAKLTNELRAFIAKNPGLRIEQINKKLGTSTKDLALPIRKLIADKAITSKGDKRSTTYFSKAKK